MASYCGIPLLPPTEAQSALVQAHFDPLEIHHGLREPFAAEVPLNEMTWPHGACRWAEGWFLCDTDQLSQIQAAGGLVGGTLKFDDGTNSVSCTVSPLTPRPLLGDPSLDRLWLLILVDRRYWWWDITVDDLDGGDPWPAYVASLAVLAGTPIAFAGVPAAFGDVPLGFNERDERLPVVLDRVASSIQCRVSVGLDGSVVLQTPAQVQASVAASLGARADVSAGSAHPLLVLPPAVKITFPTTQDGVPSRDRYSLSSPAGFPATAQPAPVAVTFDASAIAAYVAGVLSNAAELAAITGAFAASWYALNSLRHDLDYVGVYAWTPDGVTDLWLADYRTRAASRHEDEGGSDDLNLDAGAGTSEGDENNYYFTSLVIDTTNLFLSSTNWYWFNTNQWYIGVGGSIQINGPGYLIVNAPFKLYDGFWLHYRTYDFSGSSVENDLDITGDDNDRAVIRCVLDRDCSLSGLVATEDGGSGQAICLVNTSSTHKLTIRHLAVSAPVNQIACPEAADIALDPFGAVILWYDPASLVWRVMGFCCGSATTSKYERHYYEPNRWYYGGHPTDIITSVYGTASTSFIYALPFLSGPGGTIGDLGINVGTTIGGTTCRVGVYTNVADNDLQPDQLLYDSGDLSCAAGGPVTVGGGVGLDLDPNSLYWVVMHLSSSSIQPRAASSNDVWPILGSGGCGTNQAIGWTASAAYGALPGTWPSGSAAAYAPNNSLGAYLIGVSFSTVLL